MTAVAAVIPTWNRRAHLARLLDRLRAQTRPPDDIVVVDNGSTDGSAEAAERAGARTLRLPRNAGFSRAVNLGIGDCRARWIAVVNNDVEPAPDWLERLVAAAERSGAWFATGRILRAAGGNTIDGTYDLISRGACAWRAGHGMADGARFATERPIAAAPATAALFRAELFRCVGVFDERFESYLEDVEFGIRCALAGFSGIYVPTAVAWHEGSATLGRWNPDVVRLISRNQVFLVSLHYSTALIRRYWWHIVLGQGLWGLLAFRYGAGTAWLRGKVEGLRRFREVRGCGSDTLVGLLEESEREIRALQARIGRDWYWTVYFLLTPGGTK